MFCHQPLLKHLSYKNKAKPSIRSPNSEITASSVGNDTGLKMDDETRRFTAESEKWLLMLESNASTYGIATTSRHTLIVVALSLPVKLLLIMLTSMAILVSTSEHHTAPASFKCSISDTMLSRMMGSLMLSRMMGNLMLSRMMGSLMLLRMMGSW